MSYDPNIPMFMQKPGAVPPKQKATVRSGSAAFGQNQDGLAGANK